MFLLLADQQQYRLWRDNVGFWINKWWNGRKFFLIKYLILNDFIAKESKYYENFCNIDADR